MLQDNELSPPKEKSIRPSLIAIGKLAVTILILSYIYRTFQNEQKGISDVGAVFLDLLTVRQPGPNHLPILLLIIILVPVNWALESLKWQKLAQKVMPLNFWDAFRGTLTGLAVGVAVPAQLGDTIGRIASLKSDRRLEAIGAALISNGIQFYVSVVAGAIGWFHVKYKLDIPALTSQLISALLISIIVIGLVGIFFRKALIDWHPRKMIFIKAHSYLHIAGSYTPSELGFSTLFGALRYLVFLCQFAMALSLFDLGVSLLDLISCISLIFLAKTLIPAINVLGDLGLREFTALLVFASYALPAEKIIAATFLIWVVNVLGPIVIGIFLIWKYKWRL
ncbi:lysylphosphatidylglycerol synthase domain-containing protein [Dyadobacter arcticus]|uniref:Lysylphosphatidylglycerol synthase TM region n=1 Tax=Dyadobacter arcticus TaxID=1078754 RepID=A0ABX0UQ31_9BACT|nr:lysylphosphatidylglycerol synthase domain-containing protein [Dyadobacter arcticus]NIJ55099.1 hypothetical protein [Dyadobacter arcticus]